MASVRRPVLLGLPVVLVAGTLSAVSMASASAGVVQIRTLSTRADLVSGGDALVKVSVPRGARISSLRLTIDGRDVTAAFRHHSNGHGLGLLTGLRQGPNTVVATLPDG